MTALVVVPVPVAAAGAADHDLVLLDRDLDGAVAGPVLGVDGVVRDGGVEPQAVALLAVVERALERLRLATPAAPAAAAPAAASAPAALRLIVIAVAALVTPGGRACSVPVIGIRLRFRLALGLERLGDQRIVLRAQVGLVRLRARDEVLALAGLGRGELVLALERADITHRDVELVGDPGVGAALAHPRADLVQLGLK